MKQLITVFAMILLISTGQAVATTIDELIVNGHPYYDLLSKPTLTESVSAATATSREVVCASTFTISTAVTITTPIRVEKGCMLVKSGSGTINFLGPIEAGDFQWLSSNWTTTTGLSGNVKIINVKWFGATGDGSADDYQAVQNAFTLASGVTGSGVPTVYFPRGTYFRATNSLSWKLSSSIIIRGDGPDATKLKFNDYNESGGRQDGISFTDVPPNGTVELRDFTLEGQYAEAGYKLNGPKRTDGMAQGGTKGTWDGSSNGGSVDLATGVPTDDYYIGQRLGIYSGPGKWYDQEIYDYIGTSKTAYVMGNFSATPTEDSHYYIGTSPAMGFGDMKNLSSVTVHNVHMQYLRGQALNITGSTNVSITNNKLYMCARGGISVRRSKHVVIADNIIEYNGDDSIFNSQELDSEINAQNTTVTGNIIMDSNGMRFISARQLLVSNNQLIRTTTFGIRIGSIGTGTAYQPQQSIIIADNLIVDPIVRATLWYDYDSGAAYGIWLTNWREAADWSLPGEYSSAGTGTIFKPENYLYQEMTGTVSTTAGYGVTITGNQILSTLPIGTHLSAINGKGFFNSRFATNSDDAFLTEPTEAKWLNDLQGIVFGGPWHNVLIANNQVSTRGKESLAFGAAVDEGGSQVSSANFDYAYMNIAVKNNYFSRSIDSPVISMGTLTTERKYTIDIDNNVLDADPYVESQYRTSLTGTWSSGANGYCLDANYVNGVQITNNKFRNCFDPYRAGKASIVKDNIVYAHAEAVGYNSGNAGVGVVPAGGPEFYTVDYDGNPKSSGYQQINSTLLLSSSVTPTVGRYVAGHVVSKSTPSFESPRTIIGWKRLTTGATHTVGVDWAEMGVVDSTVASHMTATGTSVHGLGTMSAQASNNVAITGGSIAGTSLSTSATITADGGIGGTNGRVTMNGISQTISDATGSNAISKVVSYHETPAAQFSGSTARGTSTAPLPLYYRQTSSIIDALGYDGEKFVLFSRITTFVDGAVTTTSYPALLSFNTTSASSSTREERMVIDQSGKIGLGAYGTVLRPAYDLSLASSSSGTGVRSIGVDMRTGNSLLGYDLELHAGRASVQGRVRSVNTTPTAAGSGYTIGDWLTINGGDGTAQVYVAAVGTNGEVAEIAHTHNHGSGYSVASGIATSGGTGTGCTVEITTTDASFNKAGGNLIANSGISTGSASSSYIVKTPTPGTSGTADNALASRLTISSGGAAFTVPITATNFKGILTATTATISLGTVTSLSCSATFTVSVPGATTQMAAHATPQTHTSGTRTEAWISAAGVVAMEVCVFTAPSVTIVNSKYNVRVIQ